MDLTSLRLLKLECSSLWIFTLKNVLDFFQFCFECAKNLLNVGLTILIIPSVGTFTHCMISDDYNSRLTTTKIPV